MPLFIPLCLAIVLKTLKSKGFPEAKAIQLATFNDNNSTMTLLRYPHVSLADDSRTIAKMSRQAEMRKLLRQITHKEQILFPASKLIVILAFPICTPTS